MSALPKNKETLSRPVHAAYAQGLGRLLSRTATMGLSRVPTALGRHLYTLYLVTATDIIAVLIPQTLFAGFSVLSGRFTLDNESQSPAVLASRLPGAVLWIWLQILVLDLANQRLPSSVAEDKINKPWRPIPAERLTSEAARQILLGGLVFTLALSVPLGCVSETLWLYALNWMYNDLDLANGHWFLRNVMNALGITSIGAGATRILAGGSQVPSDGPLYAWWLLCASMILTTIHAQDLYDQEGDAARNRSTVPLELGSGTARWSVAIAVLTWTAAAPVHLGMSPSIGRDWLGYLPTLVAAVVVVVRVIRLTSVSADKVTFKIWALWTICLYALPLAIRDRGAEATRIF